MTTRIQPIREEAVKDPASLRGWLNEVVKRLLETSTRTATRKVPNVQLGVPVVTSGPDFVVGGLIVSGVKATAGAAAPAVAPWCDWTQLPDGRIVITVYGLAAAPAIYAVSLVFFESEASL